MLGTIGHGPATAHAIYHRQWGHVSVFVPQVVKTKNKKPVVPIKMYGPPMHRRASSHPIMFMPQRAAGGGRRSWPRLRWFRLATLVPWQIGNDQLWLLVCVCPCKRVHVYMHMRCDGCRLCVRFRFSATVVEDPWEGQPLPEGCSVPEKPLVSSRRKKVDCAVQ